MGTNTENIVGKKVRITVGEDDTEYTVLKSLPDDMVLIVDNPTDPTILDTIPTSMIEVVD